MWVVVHGQGLAVDAGMRRLVRDRLAISLARFGDSVGRVTVHLSADADGPAARCRVVVEVLGHRRVVADATAREPAAAVAGSAEQVGHAVCSRLGLHPWAEPSAR